MKSFANWIQNIHFDYVLKKVIAVNFNLYETDEDEIFHAQLIACESYDPTNDDWACNPVYSSEENVFEFEAEDWEEALKKFKETVVQYMKNSPQSFLNKISIITAGFVDGDIEIIKKV